MVPMKITWNIVQLTLGPNLCGEYSAFHCVD